NLAGELRITSGSHCERIMEIVDAYCAHMLRNPPSTASSSNPAEPVVVYQHSSVRCATAVVNLPLQVAREVVRDHETQRRTQEALSGGSFGGSSSRAVRGLQAA